jgi:hypothetical protein
MHPKEHRQVEHMNDLSPDIIRLLLVKNKKEREQEKTSWWWRWEGGVIGEKRKRREVGVVWCFKYIKNVSILKAYSTFAASFFTTTTHTQPRHHNYPFLLVEVFWVPLHPARRPLFLAPRAVKLGAVAALVTARQLHGLAFPCFPSFASAAVVLFCVQLGLRQALERRDEDLERFRRFGKLPTDAVLWWHTHTHRRHKRTSKRNETVKKTKGV